VFLQQQTIEREVSDDDSLAQSHSPLPFYSKRTLKERKRERDGERGSD